MDWTVQQIEDLKRLWSAGVATKEIATQIGAKSGHAVIGKARRLKLGEHPMNKDYIRKPKGQKPKWVTTKKETVSIVKPVVPKPEVVKVVVPAPVTQKESPPQDNVVIPISRRLQLVQLTERTCKWPSGDYFSKNISFCGNDPTTKSAYCKYHSKLAFQPAAQRRRSR